MPSTMSPKLASGPDSIHRKRISCKRRPNPDRYDGSPGGVVHEVLWNFTAEDGFDPEGGFIDGVTVIVKVTELESDNLASIVDSLRDG